MSFRIAPDSIQKLSLLDDATRFEPAGADPLAESQAATGVETRSAGSRRPNRCPASPRSPPRRARSR